MVALYINGQKIAWADAEKLFAQIAATQPIEFCNESGHVIATSVPGSEPVDWFHEPPSRGPSNPPSEPGYTFDEMRKRLGWD